jgi:serine phosphatase RsbU (regulator of sigma subunit)
LEEVSAIDRKHLRELDKDKEFHYSFKSIVAAPLKVHENIRGYLFAARQGKGEYPFDEEDKKSIGAFADYAAIALENAKLIKESLEKERLEKELEVAREIQYKILPHDTPDFPKLEISSLFVPAFEVGGDYYDFFDLGEGKLGFVIADVSGKGISAAFIMAEVKGIFESLSRMFSSSKELLSKVNDTLKGSLHKKDFVTAIYGIIDTKENKLNYARAGHTQLMFIRNQKTELLKPAGIGLGLDFTGNFFDSLEEEEIELEDNDLLVLYTDGITESKNEYNEEFGYERFQEAIIDNIEKDLEDMSNSIMQKLTVFSKDNSQHDDITLVIFRYLINKKSIGVS